MIGRLKEAVDLLKSPENRSECDSVNDAIGILIDFVTLAIKSEWKWPIATHHYRCDSNDCGKCNCKQFLTEKTILDACLAAHAAEKAEVEKRNKFSSRTILAGIKYEKLSPEKKDLADKLLKIIGGQNDRDTM